MTRRRNPKITVAADRCYRCGFAADEAEGGLFRVDRRHPRLGWHRSFICRPCAEAISDPALFPNGSRAGFGEERVRSVAAGNVPSLEERDAIRQRARTRKRAEREATKHLPDSKGLASAEQQAELVNLAALLGPRREAVVEALVAGGLSRAEANVELALLRGECRNRGLIE